MEKLSGVKLCPTLSPRAKSLIGQILGTSMTQALYKLYTHKHRKLLHIMSLPPTDKNVYPHMRLAYLLINVIWKAIQVGSSKGSCPYYLAPSRGEVVARAGPRNGDTDDPRVSTPI